jgi:hypothetical protein
MSFWSSANIEPKRQYRWVFSLSRHFNSGWMVKSVTKPVATVAITEHNFLGHKYKYPGVTTWNDISITLVDPVQPDSVSKLAKILRESGYNPPTSFPNRNIAVESLSKKKSTNTLGEVFIRQVNAEGVKIEEWKLTNPVVKSADFGGTLDYSQEGLIEVKLELAYDWAQLNAGGERYWNVGQTS